MFRSMVWKYSTTVYNGHVCTKYKVSLQEEELASGLLASPVSDSRSRAKKRVKILRVAWFVQHTTKLLRKTIALNNLDLDLVNPQNILFFRYYCCIIRPAPRRPLFFSLSPIFLVRLFFFASFSFFVLRFHSTCLYKWFHTSHKNKCPICQQTWA